MILETGLFIPTEISKRKNNGARKSVGVKFLAETTIAVNNQSETILVMENRFLFSLEVSIFVLAENSLKIAIV